MMSTGKGESVRACMYVHMSVHVCFGQRGVQPCVNVFLGVHVSVHVYVVSIGHICI